jgi:hypothetical protein
MNRRKFIKTTTLIGAGLTIAPATVMAKPKRDLWHIGMSLPAEMRKAHELMVAHNYYWFNLFGMEPVDDAPYTQSEYLETFLDTSTKISIRMYHEGEHWMLQDQHGKWKVVHKGWVQEWLSRMIYAQKRGMSYQGCAVLNGTKTTHTFVCQDGSLHKIVVGE